MQERERKTLWLAGLAQRPTPTPESRQAVSYAVSGLEHWRPTFFHEGEGRGSAIVTCGHMVDCMAMACIDSVYYLWRTTQAGPSWQRGRDGMQGLDDDEGKQEGLKGSSSPCIHMMYTVCGYGIMFIFR